MINANELRIGNWVNRCPSDNPDEWLQGQVEHILPEMWGSELIEPIPLTPEVLLKCGWEDKGYYQNGRFRASFLNDGSLKISLPTNGDDSGIMRYYFDTYPKYLHQLQNLYFALTQTELTYKP